MLNSCKVISLFSGAGGMDLGFINQGFDIVWANDIDSAAVETYKHNIGDHIVLEDITKISEEDIPDGDIVVAGFPCQPFSNAGSRKGIYDSRGTLFEHALRIVKTKKPKFVLFENVRGILSIHNGELIERIKKELETMGYTVKYKLINASDYGVPQNRYRVIIMAFADGYTFEFPEPIAEKKALTIENTLKSISKNAKNQERVRLSPQTEHLIKFIREGSSWKEIPYDKLPDRMKRIRNDMKRYHSPNFYRRFHRSEIMGTITSSATPENSGIIHHADNRKYTVRECAKFQTFPDNFVFLGSLSQQYKQVGNAVPPLLSEMLAATIKKQLAQHLLEAPILIRR
ncbi:MAG: DNA cytosine methyltransferase [Nanoarchaeota archaeon]